MLLVFSLYDRSHGEGSARGLEGHNDERERERERGGGAGKDGQREKERKRKSE